MKKSYVVLLVGLLFLGFDNPKSADQLTVVTNNPGDVISKDIYGQFSEHLGHCIYGGLWVGEDSKIRNYDGLRADAVDALKAMGIPNLRWPGGCFADTYHWMDGIGPRDKRPSIVNTYWGGVTEDNSFGTHEFMDLVERLGCDAYISGNLGSGTVQEMSNWVEYLTSDTESPMTELRKKNGRDKPWKVKFFGIGNENWGCGGNMTADYYADVMRRYSTYLRNENGNRLYKVACGASGDDYDWTQEIMSNPKNRGMFQGYSIHNYTVVGGWRDKSSATKFSEKEWFETFKLNMNIEDLIKKHAAIMDRYDPNNRIGLVVDEWGNWFNVEPGTNPGFLYQQNTLRDAITAAINLNIFNRHCDRVKMANLAQVVNVLQALILTKDDKMVLTPTYYVFKMFKVHQNAKILPLDLKSEDYTYDGESIPAINASASIDSTGKVHISLANLNPNKDINLSCFLVGDGFSKASGEILTADKMNAMNTFDNPGNLKPAEFKGFNLKGENLDVKMPAKSVVVIELSN